MRPASAALAVALAGLLTPASTADLAFTLEHNLGPGGGWTRAGQLAGDLGGALTAAKAGRGVVPALTLTRSSTSLSAAEQESLSRLVARGGMYTVRATAEKADPGATTSVARTSVPLLASAPAACVAARGGDAPLKLDGALTLSTPGDWASEPGLEVTGLTFDFHSLRCGGGGGGGRGDGEGRAAWAPPSTSPVPLWLPAAAPPVLPAPETLTPGRAGAGAAGSAALEGEGGGEGGDEKGRPEPPKRSNWIFILPLVMLVVNILNAVAAPPPQAPGRSGAARRAE